MKKRVRFLCAALTASAVLFSTVPNAEAEVGWGKILGGIIGEAINNSTQKKSDDSSNSTQKKNDDSSRQHLGTAKLIKHDQITREQDLLIQSAIARDHEMVKRLLGTGIDINNVYQYSYSGGNVAIGDTHVTLLEIAFNNDDRELMQYLLENGADVTGHPYYGKKGMWVSYYVQAAAWGNISCMEYLRDWGADTQVTGVHGSPFSITFFGDNALLAAMHRIYNSFDKDVKAKRLNMVRYLIDNGININYQNTIDGNTALMESITDDEDMFNMLLSAGADTTIKNYKGQTAYDIAVDYKKLNYAKILIDYPH